MIISHIRRVSKGAPYPEITLSSSLTRALLAAALCTHLSTITASVLPSLPASAPGFVSGPVVPAKHNAAASNEAWVHTPIIDPVAPTLTDLDFKQGQDEDDNDKDRGLEYEDISMEDERMGVDGMGNGVDKGVMRHYSTSTTSPPPLQYSTTTPRESDRPASFLTHLLHLARIASSLGFWKSLLGSFLVFWVLIASTAAALVVVGIKVRRWERNGRLRRWGGRLGVEMRMQARGRKEGGGRMMDGDADADADEGIGCEDFGECDEYGEERGLG